LLTLHNSTERSPVIADNPRDYCTRIVLLVYKYDRQIVLAKGYLYQLINAYIFRSEATSSC